MAKFVFLGFLFLLLAGIGLGSYQSVHMKDVTSLVLQSGQFTTGRRSAPVPQLTCVGGSASSEAYRIDTIHCKQIGFDGINPTWECSAVLDQDIRLGKTDVVCEGYAYPEDPYILAGSCGVEYELQYTWQSKPQYREEPVVETVVEETVVEHGYDYGYGRPTTTVHYEEIEVGPYSEPHIVIVEDIEYPLNSVVLSLFLVMMLVLFFTCAF